MSEFFISCFLYHCWSDFWYAQNTENVFNISIQSYRVMTLVLEFEFENGQRSVRNRLE